MASLGLSPWCSQGRATSFPAVSGPAVSHTPRVFMSLPFVVRTGLVGTLSAALQAGHRGLGR